MRNILAVAAMLLPIGVALAETPADRNVIAPYRFPPPAERVEFALTVELFAPVQAFTKLIPVKLRPSPILRFDPVSRRRKPVRCYDIPVRRCLRQCHAYRQQHGGNGKDVSH